MARLVEYVVIAGIKKPVVDSTQSPDMLRRFPITDHKDFPLPPDIVFFCQPEGCTTASKRISLRQINSFVFTLTDKETGITRYGICCNFYRPCLGAPQKRHSQIARSLSTDSPNNPDEILINIVKGLESTHVNVGRTKSTPLINGKIPPQQKSQIHSNSMICYSLTSICIVSSFPFISTFRECLFVLRKLIESRCWSKPKEPFWKNENVIYFDGNQNIGHLPLMECRNWTIFFNNHDLNSHFIKSDLLEIENWISNLLKIPLPVAGLNRVEVELLPRHVQPPITFALPEKSRFSYLDYPVHLPLELLGVETCLKILTCIVLEHKVVLQSCDYNALSISVMALTSMLYPLEYMFPIIPLLPTCMKNAEQLLLAPTPYVIGIPTSFFRIKGMNFQVPHDVLIVDLDTNKMSVPLSMDEIPPLPEPEGSTLKMQLKQCLACLSLSPQPLYDLDKVNEHHIPRKDSVLTGDRSHTIYGNDIDSVDIAVRAALVKFFCSDNVLGGFAEHTRVIRLFPRPVVAFQKEAFIKSRRDESAFIKALCETQSVEYYGEWSVNPDNIVFRKISSGILDPRIIGDKPRWYSHYVQPFYYQVHNPHSRLGFDLYEDSDSDDDDDSHRRHSTIKEGKESSEGSHCAEHCSCCSSVDSSDDSVYTSSSGKSDSISTTEDELSDKIHSMYDTSYSNILTKEETDDLQETLMKDSVVIAPPYRAETDLNNRYRINSDIEGSMLEPLSEESDREHYATSSTSSDSSKPSELSHPVSVRRLGSLIGSIKPKLQARLSTDSQSSNVSVSSILSTQTDRTHKTSPVLHKWNSEKGLEKNYNLNSFTQATRTVSQDGNIYNSENQQLITEVVGYVKSGDGVGWLSTKRLRRIVSYEGLRQYLINQIDIVQKGYKNTLLDVHISRNVYRGYLELMKLLVEGYEHSYRLKGLGGLSSVFSFLEVTHRYYCGKKYEDDSTKVTVDTPSMKRSTSIVENIKESTIRIDSNQDKDSDSSYNYNRELGEVKGKNENQQKPNSKSKRDSPGHRKELSHTDSTESPSLTHSSLGKRHNKENMNHVNGDVANQKVDQKAEKYLVNKSNVSNGFRFYGGEAVKSVLESAGRGVTGTGRRYLFEGLQRHRSPIWDSMEFWDACFLDFVAVEREAAGMDVNPAELISRYKSLGDREKQLLEDDEDNLLGILLHNMAAFMLCMGVDKKLIKSKVRRLLAKSHIGLTQTQSVDNLLDVILDMQGNDVDLLVPRSRQLKIQIYVVHLGDTQTGAVFFLEVREDCIVLKSTNGSVVDRWWYENVVNLSCSPKTKVLCIWIRSGEETGLQKICTKKCKVIYNSIKESMKKAAERLEKNGAGINLGGNFTVVDSFTGQQGVLKVSLEGVTILFVDKKLTIDVRHLKNCCAKRKVLVVEEYLPHNQSTIEHQFHSEEANEICYAILCLFSYIAAAKNTSATSTDASSSEHGTLT